MLDNRKDGEKESTDADQTPKRTKGPTPASYTSTWSRLEIDSEKEETNRYSIKEK